jgi:hypothetical protein
VFFGTTKWLLVRAAVDEASHFFGQNLQMPAAQVTDFQVCAITAIGPDTRQSTRDQRAGNIAATL